MKILAAVLALVALALAFVVLRRRRPPAPRDAIPSVDPDPDAVEAAPAPRPPTAALAPTTAATAHTEDSAPQEVGADFYDEVVGLLEAELERNPQRQDLRIKLLEVYAATERKAEFVRLAALHLGDPGSEPSGREQVLDMGRRLAPGHALFTSGDASTPPPDTAESAPSRHRRYYETLDPTALAALQTELHRVWQGLRQDLGFWERLREACAEQVQSPAALVHAKKLSLFVGGAQILVKNESERPPADAARISAIGQVLLAPHLGRSRVLAALADPGHALAVATAARQLGLDCEVVVSESDRDARREEVDALAHAGVTLVPATSAEASPVGSDGQREALHRALESGGEALFISPLSAGPPPYPAIVRELQQLSGLELKSQVQAAIGRAPDGLIVSAMDGISSIGFLQAFLANPAVKLFCVEAGPGGGSRHHRLAREHGWLRASQRVRYSSVPEEVARFAAEHCMPDGAGPLGLAGGEVLVETFTLARQFSPREVVVVVLPAEPAAAA